MKRALLIAENGRYTCSPNPMVGCVIVKNENLVSEGWHVRAGEEHAEIIALRNAGEAARGSDVYVTLEPCCHYGRTPPCVDSLIEAGVKRVFISALDPNPRVNGNGVLALRNAGIEVFHGIRESEAKKQNEFFFHSIINGIPFVIAKWAMSLNGKTISNNKWITGEKAREDVHHLRNSVDAILVGGETVRKDNPLLTVRIPEKVRNPKRIVVTQRGDLPLSSNVFNRDAETIVFTTRNADKSWIENVVYKGVIVHILDVDYITDLRQLLMLVGGLSLLVEGGMRTIDQFVSQNLVNRFYTYVSPKYILESDNELSKRNIVDFGGDFCFISDN